MEDTLKMVMLQKKLLKIEKMWEDRKVVNVCGNMWQINILSFQSYPEWKYFIYHYFVSIDMNFALICTQSTEFNNKA